MGEVFFRNTYLNRDGSERVISEERIKEILRDVRAVLPASITMKRRGAIIKLYHNSDINDILTRAKPLLQRYGIDPQLGKTTKPYREVMVSNVPEYVYNETLDNLKADMEKRNELDIIELKKCTNGHIKVTLKSREIKDESFAKRLVASL